MLFACLIGVSEPLHAQRSVADWHLYFKDHYQLELITDSASMAKLRLNHALEYRDGGIYFIASKYNIVYQSNDAILQDHLDLLAREVAQYPKDYFQQIQMKYLCLVGSALYQKQNREAIPDPFRKALILESSNRLRKDTTYLKHAFHHDLFHYTEHVVGRQQPVFKKWSKMNTRGFQYRGSGAMQYNPKYANVDWFHIHPRKGFITNYAMTDASEDRAEMAAHLLIPEKRKVLLVLLQEDKILQKKANQIVEFLRTLSVSLDHYFVN